MHFFTVCSFLIKVCVNMTLSYHLGRRCVYITFQVWIIIGCIHDWQWFSHQISEKKAHLQKSADIIDKGITSRQMHGYKTIIRVYLHLILIIHPIRISCDYVTRSCNFRWITCKIWLCIFTCFLRGTKTVISSTFKSRALNNQVRCMIIEKSKCRDV